MSTVTELQDNNRKKVRKHGNQIFAVAPLSVTVPEKTAMFGADGLPVLPTGAKILGYITTDGISEEIDMSVETVEMIQDLEPVRSDMQSRVRTLSVNFGEANAWTTALRAGVPVEDWPSDRDADFFIEDGEITEYPYMRGFIITQDGVGDAAEYRFEIAHCMQISGLESRSLNRSDAETFGQTFTCFKDEVTVRSYTKASSHRVAVGG